MGMFIMWTCNLLSRTVMGYFGEAEFWVAEKRRRDASCELESSACF